MCKKLYLLAGLLFAFTSMLLEVAGQTSKARVISMTDGEIDDRSSMIRFLLYTNDIELLAIIQTNSVFQPQGWSKDKWIEKEINAYEQVYPNLHIHDTCFPTADELRSKLFVGDEDKNHLGTNAMSVIRAQRTESVIDPSNWPDTPGSDKIVEVLLEDDPRLIYIQAWGGGNTAARAFFKLKTQYPDDYERAVSKVVMYNIWYQDGAGTYIERYHPKVTMLISYYFSGTWAYGDQRYTYQFIDDVKKNMGPLGALYPQTYVSEGDSPSFLYSIDNGLRSHEDPTYGGWGGRFYWLYGNVYRDVSKGSYAEWVEYANRDFEARMNWCVASKFEDANHKPVIKIAGNELNKTVHSGEKVELVTEVSDPDGQGVSVLWWQYKEAGTYDGMIQISNPNDKKISFTAPYVTRPGTIHLIIEAKDRSRQILGSSDKGKPSLTSFKRLIITVIPAY